VSEKPLGTGEDFRYGQTDVFDSQVCLVEMSVLCM